MMRNILLGLIILTLFTGFFLSHEAFAVNIQADEAMILFLRGDVKVKKAPSAEWLDAVEEMVLFGGDQLKTGDNSWAEIGIGEDFANVVRVEELTLVELTELGPTEINLLKGELRALVERIGADETFEIRTPTSVCGVRGTGWDISTDGRKVTVDVYEEEIYFVPLPEGGGMMEDPIIKSGKRGILEDPAKPIEILDLPPGKMRDWKKWKQDFKQRMGAKKGVKGKLGGVGKGQKALQNMIKGKQNIFEKKDKDFIDKRIEKSDKGGSP
jgi:hypothetical protein